MKRIFKSIILLFCFAVLILAQEKDNGRGRYEFYKIIFPADNSIKVNSVLNPDEEMKIDLNLQKYKFPVTRKIRVSGGGIFPKPFNERNEESFRRFLYQINDCLDSTTKYNEKYSLLFQPEGTDIDQNAFFRLSMNEFKSGVDAEVILSFKSENLKYYSNEKLYLELQFYSKTDALHSDDIFDASLSSIKIPVPEGSYGWNEIKEKIKLPENIACIVFRLGGKNYSGKCYFGTPKFIQYGKNILPPFMPYELDKKNWIGENLSSKEWPQFEFKFDEKVIYSGKVFDRASEVSEFEIDIPADSVGKHVLSIKKLNTLPVSFPFAIRKLDLIEKSSRDFEVISVPEYIRINNNFSVLVETNKPEVELSITSSSNISTVQNKLIMSDSGLHVVKFYVKDYDGKSFIEIRDSERSEKIFIKHVLLKNDDNIKISTTDEIYINRTKKQFSNYLEWYLKNGIGNVYGFRPSYQWSGVRVTDTSFYNWALSLLKELDIPYSLMIEGRSLPEKNINPDENIMASKYYMGRQAHENDGNFYYWGHWQWADLYSDLMAKYKPQGGIFAKCRPVRTERGNYVFFDPYSAKDMADASNIFVNNLRNSKGKSTRHTGPSMMFRYIYQAGYKWLGAEQMYGPEELVMSSIRGASKVYGKTDFGTHLATQWSSAPFDVPEHSTRLFLSLAISYMHGANHINTEDGLWNVEAGYDRYTESGKEHIQMQKRMYDFIQTHERRGTFVTPTAILQGRNCAWNDFGRGNAWQQDSSIWKWSYDRESFDLLKVFSPNSKLDAIYNGNCKREKQGWYSGTPYGPIDLLPIEASKEILKSYKSIAFLGWNTFQEDDFKRLSAFVKNGGTLLLARPHLNIELKYNLSAKLPNSRILNEMLGKNFINCKDIIKRRVGKGNVIYFPQNKYPADPSIRAEYEKELAILGDDMIKSERKKGWIKGNNLIEFTAYDWGSYRTIYLLNTDWWSDTTIHQTKFLLDDKEFSVDVRRRFIEVITIKDDYAIMAEDMGTDVKSIEKDKNELIIKVQTTSSESLLIFNKSSQKPIEHFIKEPGLHELRIPIDK